MSSGKILHFCMDSIYSHSLDCGGRVRPDLQETAVRAYLRGPEVCSLIPILELPPPNFIFFINLRGRQSRSCLCCSLLCLLSAGREKH
jgi:hypothetical protein